jgi:hypothetical protein
MRIMRLAFGCSLFFGCATTSIQVQNSFVTAEVLQMPPLDSVNIDSGYLYELSASKLGGSNIAYQFDSVWNATGGHRIRKMYPYAPTHRFTMHLAEQDSVAVTYYDANRKPLGMPLRFFLAPGSYDFDWIRFDKPAGKYFCICTIGSTSWIKLLLIMK